MFTQIFSILTNLFDSVTFCSDPLCFPHLTIDLIPEHLKSVANAYQMHRLHSIYSFRIDFSMKNIW